MKLKIWQKCKDIGINCEDGKLFNYERKTMGMGMNKIFTGSKCCCGGEGIQSRIIKVEKFEVIHGKQIGDR